MTGRACGRQPRGVNFFLKCLCGLLLSITLAHADLEDIRKTGTLKVAVYNDFWPWSLKSSGLDADIGEALAKRLGLKVELLPFDAKDDMEDDLRNMVWKGYYLGYGPADVMMHVPVEQGLISKVQQVKIFAPYFHERIMLGYNSEKFPDFTSPDSLGNARMGVEKISLSAMVLLSVEGGKYVNQTRIYDSAQELMKGLRDSEVAMVMATQSQIEAGTNGDARFRVQEALYPQIPGKGWSIGLAVKSENVELARGLQAAMNDLVSSGELGAICQKRGVKLVSP
jgi:cystine transport system substrate-binding protein